MSSDNAWSARLEFPKPREIVSRRADDPRLSEVIEVWQGDPAALTPGRVVLLGFPQDEGVRRNSGRPGAAQAPREILRYLHRLTAADAEHGIDLRRCPPLDAGSIRLTGALEETQIGLGEVVAGLLRARAVPVVLGGGHEAAFGHYLGHAGGAKPCAIINVDAHLDVRPYTNGLGHSGSPFRQALEHPEHPLPGASYVCLGAQPSSVSSDHANYLRERGGVIGWAESVRGRLDEAFLLERDRLIAAGNRIYVTLDADAAHMADVPGVSAPNPCGLSGQEIIAWARLVGRSTGVASFDLVEINPTLDRDGQSCRWAALVIWQFLMGVAERDDKEFG